jgi:hypothetical protein
MPPGFAVLSAGCPLRGAACTGDGGPRFRPLHGSAAVAPDASVDAKGAKFLDGSANFRYNCS